MGCQDLLDDVPGRSRKGDQQQQAGMFSSPSDLKSFMKGVTRSSSKSYNIKDETSTKSKERKSTFAVGSLGCFHYELLLFSLNSFISNISIQFFRRDHGCTEVGQCPGGANELEDVLAAGLGSTVMTSNEILIYN